MLALYKALKFIFRHWLPKNIRYPLARALARVTLVSHAKRRRILVANLIPIVGPQRAPQLASSLFRNFAMTSVDFFCPHEDLAANIEEENTAFLKEACRRGKVIVVSAHIGNWELGMNYLIRQGYSMAGIYALYREDAVVRWIMSHRNPVVEWIPAAPGAVQAGTGALARGKVLAMAGDIPYGERGRRVKICGAWTRLPLGPWAIAALAKAAVVPGFVLRVQPGQYRVRFHEPIIPPDGTLRYQMAVMQDAYRQQLEGYLKAYPEQWGCLQPFWDLRSDAVKTKPMVDRSALGPRPHEVGEQGIIQVHAVAHKAYGQECDHNTGRQHPTT